MRDEIVSSYDFSKGLNKYLLVNGEGTQAKSHDEEVSPAQVGIRADDSWYF